MPTIDISKRLVEPYVAPSWTSDPSSHQMTFSPALTATPKLHNLHNRHYATPRAFHLSKTFSWHLCFLLLVLWLKGAEGILYETVPAHCCFLLKQMHILSLSESLGLIFLASFFSLLICLFQFSFSRLFCYTIFDFFKGSMRDIIL